VHLQTFGEQTEEAEAHRQLDYAIDHAGINFIDTAEVRCTGLVEQASSHPQLVPDATDTVIGNEWVQQL
jgi:aryl-alcohol dehydrogenase-like predicted oxidoreductase